MPINVKIGLFGIGLDTYWPQFNEWKNKLVGYQGRIRARLKREDVTKLAEILSLEFQKVCS